MLQNSSQLMIAGAIIHESIHAYINYNIQTYVGGFQVPADYNSGKFWLYSLNVWSTLDGLPGNYRDHSEMLSGYFGQAVSALKAWDNGAHTDKEYAMIMLYGLDTGDLPPSQASLTSAFSTNMSTYGITNANLQSFWSSQLNSTNNKLPTGGC